MNRDASGAPNGSVMVVGGGIAGMQSALDLANSGYYVYLLEKSPTIGGVMSQLDKTFPTNDCAMWIISPKLVEVGRHINIELITCATVEEIAGEKGDFTVTVRRQPRFVDIDKCTGCGDCTQITVDEVTQPRELDGELWIDRIRIDEAKCTHCGECIRACLEENQESHALTSVVRQGLEMAEAETTSAFPSNLERLLRMSVQEREAFWREQFQKCIKCYGCIEQCPVYLEEPEGLKLSDWVTPGTVPPEAPAFHLIRAFQIWDTCVLCAECELTCPSHIPLKLLQDIVRYFPPAEVFELVPGLQPKARQAVENYLAQLQEASRSADHVL